MSTYEDFAGLGDEDFPSELDVPNFKNTIDIMYENLDKDANALGTAALCIMLGVDKDSNDIRGAVGFEGLRQEFVPILLKELIWFARECGYEVKLDRREPGDED